MMPGERVAAVIAAYNAGETVGAVVRGARRYVEAVLVADDGSTDGTGAAAAAAGAIVLPLGANRGKGAALRALFGEAARRGYGAVIALDADGQHDPADIPGFLRAHRRHPEAVITGSRFACPERIPRDRRNSMTVARFFVSLAANQFVEDCQCGFRVYPLAAIRSMALTKGGYVTETEILMKAGDAGRRIVTVPVEARYPPGHGTHFRTVRDVAAIARYVISYLMVKWAIESVRPGRLHTYRGPRTGRDTVFLSPGLDLVFESLTVAAALPLTALYVAWHAAGRALGVPAVRSLGACGRSPARVLLAVLLLPALLGMSVLDLARAPLGMRADPLSRLVRAHYAHAWPAA
jgi:glycosyltransferase involved in cell wall biosynthesis